MNSKDPLTAYFHPTTACFIDDNESFMAGLALVLPEHMLSVAFFDPLPALDYVNKPHDMPTLADRCFSAARKAQPSLFRMDTDLVEQEINILQRFNRLSVVVVDYSMPGLNGLQFCEQIKDPQIGKVLLTGVADEKMAVQAFNAGIIDRFISKSQPQASDHISDFCREMQRTYFRNQTQQMRQTLRLAGPVFLDDSSVTAWVRRQMVRKNFCEYYMVSDPPGLLLVTPSGKLQQMIVLSAIQCDAQADYAELHGAPSEIVKRLRNRSHVGFFLEDPASYDERENYPWGELLHKATELGDQTSKEGKWYAALVPEPPANIDYQPDSVCLEAWLRTRSSHRPPHSSSLTY